MKIVVIGSNGFVGSAFVRAAKKRGWEVVCVNRDNYATMIGTESDLVVEAACNSRKFFAEEQPFAEFDTSVGHRLRTLQDFKAPLQLHLSSVDVYSDMRQPSLTMEATPIDFPKSSFYGVHKRIAEELVEKYAPRWLILRLAGMVGLGLKKNPVHDILHGQPLRIHPESKYQFMPTDAVANIALQLVEKGLSGEIINVCGNGLISPRQIAEMAGKPLDLTALAPEVKPRIVHINIERISSLSVIPDTAESVLTYLHETAHPMISSFTA